MKKNKVIIALLFILFGGFSLPLITINTNASDSSGLRLEVIENESNWIYKDDGYSYFKHTMADWQSDDEPYGATAIVTPHNQDLYYRVVGSDADWKLVESNKSIDTTGAFIYSSANWDDFNLRSFTYVNYDTWSYSLEYYDTSLETSKKTKRYDYAYHTVVDSSPNNKEYGYEYEFRFEGPIREEYIPPVITGPTNIIAYSNKRLSSEAIISHLNIEDASGYHASIDSYGGYATNWNKPGVYEVTVRAVDRWFNTSTHDMTITVINIEQPSFSTVDKVNWNISERHTFTTGTLIQKGLLAFYTKPDEESSNLIVMTSNPVLSMNKPGVVTAKFEAKYNGAIYEKTIEVTLVDDIAPIISGPNEITVGISRPLSYSEILAKYTAYDTETEANIAVSGSLNAYTLNRSKIGKYEVTISAKDQNKNEAVKTVTIEVVDDSAPIISGPRRIIISNGTYFNTETLKSMYSIHDSVDGAINPNRIYVMSDSFTGNGNRNGRYKVVLAVSDRAKNVATQEVEIEVTSAISRSIIVDNKLVKIAANTKFDSEDIAKSIYAIMPGLKNVTNLRMSFDLINYQDNHANIGYKETIIVNFQATNGVTYAPLELELEVVTPDLFANPKESTSDSFNKGLLTIVLFVAIGFVGYAVIKRRKRK